MKYFSAIFCGFFLCASLAELLLLHDVSDAIVMFCFSAIEGYFSWFYSDRDKKNCNNCNK